MTKREDTAVQLLRAILPAARDLVEDSGPEGAEWARWLEDMERVLSGTGLPPALMLSTEEESKIGRAVQAICGHGGWGRIEISMKHGRIDLIEATFSMRGE